MEPHENQYRLQDHFTGSYFSSLLSQPEYKVSRADHVRHPGFVWEPWPRASMTSTQGLSFFDPTQHSRNELEDELQPHLQHQWRSGTNFSSTISHTTTQPQLSVSNRYESDYHDYFNVVPSIHLATSNLCSSLVSSSLDLNLQVAADILATPPTCDDVSSRSSLYHALGGALESPRSSSNITLNSQNGGGKTKNSGNFSETKYSHHSAPKKLRTMPRSSCPPLKVRKEKLGDRIAALQRLVAPYGKTDTASVLTEAIGYIQFLHDQIQTLSVPYMESSNNKSTRTMQSNLNGKIQPTRDLTSRGLSLVPLSYASCFNTYN